MSKMQRTNVYADPEDLAQIKENARKLGISEAEILRRAIKIAAMETRVWDDDLEWPEFHGGGGPYGKEAIRDAVMEGVEGRSR
jgi:hypothetical protein